MHMIVQRITTTEWTWMAYLLAAEVEVSCQSPRGPPDDASWPAVIALMEAAVAAVWGGQAEKNHMASAGSQLRILQRGVFQLLFLSRVSH